MPERKTFKMKGKNKNNKNQEIKGIKELSQQIFHILIKAKQFIQI